MSKSNWSPVLLVLLITPIVIAPFVLLGVYLGFYLGGATGVSKAILAIALSTVGFLVSVVILVKVVIVRMARKWRPSA
ncbi:MAG TPA: hypothetical protein VEJ36_00805 [Nitrososphaerales archaeon]|nr:hypothetical protein [Nitrososphaerales archaeon]